jgi:hypothetical protein
MPTIYKRWDAGKFPWLVSDDNEWSKEREFPTKEAAFDYLSKHGSNAYEYKIV